MPRISKVKLPNNTVADIYGKSIVLTYGQKPTEAQVNDLVEVFSGSANTPTFINYTVGGNVDVMVPATIQGDDGTYVNVSGIYANNDNSAHRLRVQLTPLFPYSEVKADWTKESLDGAHVFLPGDGDHSGVQKHGDSLMDIDATSSALTTSSLVENAGNIAGIRGYHWSSVDISSKTFTFDSAVTGWAVGDTISSIVSGSRYVNFGKITAINDVNVTVDTLPFSAVTTSSVYGNQVACIMDKPDCGDFDLGIAAHAEGFKTTATNKFTHSEGYLTHAIGEMAHAEGQGTTAIYTAHAEGRDTTASGNFAHSEGRLSTASGVISHAEGYNTEATSGSSHAEGNGSKTAGQQAHAEGYLTLASGAGAHAEGSWTIASGRNAHAESGNWVGYIYPVGDANAVSYTAAIDSDYQAEIEKFGPTVFCDIMKTSFIRVNSKVVRFTSFAISGSSFTFTVERTLSATALDGTTAFVASTSNAYGPESHAETGARASYGSRSHAEGRGSISIGYNSHVEGHESIGRGEDSHAEGYNTETGGIDDYSANTKTAGTTSTIVQTDKKGGFAHAEGNSTIAFGLASHSEGTLTFAKGESSHAEGISTITKNKSEHAEGQFNVSNKASDTFGNSGNTHTSIGIGTSDTGRTNAIEIMENGNTYLYGVGGYDGTTISGAKTLQQAISESTPMVSITWSALKTQRDNSQLIPGMQYRITDYNCTTTETDTQSAGHQFDVIVVADAVNKLNENARAAIHSGDTYFTQVDAKLGPWELKYCLDNDINRFSWADSGSTGRGVIYYMKDEWNNECPYDFKNIQFKRNLTQGKLDNTSGVETWVYTFNAYDLDSEKIEDASVIVGRDADDDMTEYCFGNTIAPYHRIYSAIDVSLILNNTVFLNISPSFECYFNRFGEDCYGNTLGFNCYINAIGDRCTNNTFGNKYRFNNLGNDCGANRFKEGCNSNTFGNNCSNNTFGEYCTSTILEKNCSNNTFGDYCAYNSLGNYCGNNSFGNFCDENSFGNNCGGNSFGDNCDYNSFGNFCDENSFGNNCDYNSFENNCGGNRFGNNCYDNSFGNACRYIKFVNVVGSVLSYYRDIIVENGNQYINLYCTSTTSSNSPYRNVKIAQGVNNTSTTKTIADPNVNQDYQTVYQPANSQIISV